MIEKPTFVTGMTALSAAFGREIDGGTQAMYYGVLNPRLTTDEFERAVSLTLSSETFWPSPAVLLGKVKADDATRGLLAFEHVTRVMRQSGGHRYLSFDKYTAEFDAPTKAAISAVGGLPAITNTSEERWAGLQKRFAAAYVESTQPRLAAPQTDAKVKQLVRDTSAMLSGRDRAAGVDR
jgi:hypothetical protein